jgi:2-polyprenyl-6-methoxyphenol hydroxylase-like FAD-dependent oxidoreductase
MDTKFLSFEEDTATSTVISTVEDNVTGQQYKIRSKYLFGADGARSVIVKQLGLELQGRQSDNLAIDVLVKADLSHLVEHRKGNLHWLIQPDVEHPVWGWLGVARMVKPWHEWIFSLFPSIGYDPKTAARPSDQEYLKRVKEFIGDNTPVEMIRVSKWYINATPSTATRQ